VRGEAIVSGAGETHLVNARRDEFIPTVDRYFLRVAIAARDALRGEPYVAV
jgi:hypothetical protein